MLRIPFWLLVSVTILVAGGTQEGEESGIHWHDLQVTISRDGAPVVHSCSGVVKSGDLCGIVGPSGAGKSTFMAALGGVTSSRAGLDVSGSIWWQDENSTTTLFMRDGQVAWLQQNDSFFSMLTPREALDMAAFLEFPALSKSERDEIVGSSLDSLGLKKVQHRAIGDRTTSGLSGGEKRRLSVALELLTTPRLFLADEPTTGLDSSQAVKVVRLIARLAKERNIPCLCTIHQPRASIWRMLDSVILLAPGGRVCYMGKREDATRYFRDVGYKCPPETNPAEFLLDLVSVDTEDPVQAQKDEERIDELATTFAKRSPKTYLPSIVTTKSTTKGLVLKPAFLIRRTLALLRRSLRQNIRNHKVNALRLGTAIGNSVLFSQIFSTVRKDVPTAKSLADRVALLTFGVINMSMMALMKTIDLFAKERPVVDREQMRNQYSSLEYLVSKVIAEIPLDTLFAAVFTTLLKSTTGLRIPLGQLTATFSLITVTSVALGFAVGSATHTAESAMATGVPLMVIFMVVGIINPSGVDKSCPPPEFLRLLKMASPIRWAVDALCIGEYRGMQFEDSRRTGPFRRLRDLPKMGAFALVQNGDQVLDALGLEDATYDNVMKQLAMVAATNLLISWFGLHFGGMSFEQASNDSSKAGSSSSSQANPTVKVPVVRKLG